MARQTTIISIFLASPSDVSDERSLIVRSIERWNAIRGKAQGYLLELINWENATSSAIGLDGQDVVNNQIGDDYDAMIAIFWHRVGSPTGRAVSGTAEEYDRALKRFKDNEPIEIGVYFKSANPPMAEIDTEQLQGVINLKKKMQDDGVYHKSFIDDDGLSFEIEMFIDRLVRSHKSGVLARNVTSTKLTIDPKENYEDKVPLEEEDLGYLDLSESIDANSERLTRFLQASSVKLEEITAVTREGSQTFQELVALGSPDPAKVRAVVAGVTQSFNSYSDTVESGIDEFAESMAGIANDSIGLIRVSADFPSDEDDARAARSSLMSLLENMDGAMDGLESFADSVKGLQRMTVAFNQARKRLVANTSRIVQVMTSARPILEEAIRNIT